MLLMLTKGDKAVDAFLKAHPDGVPTIRSLAELEAYLKKHEANGTHSNILIVSTEFMAEYLNKY